MKITPEVLAKIDKAHSVSTAVMSDFKKEQPEAFALTKFNPVSQESTTSSTQKTNKKSSSSGGAKVK